MAKLNESVNINNIFALSNWTSGEGYFFTTLEGAKGKGEVINGGRNVAGVGIIEMELQENEFVPVRRYEVDGTLIEVDEG